jgi:hypothetical protein
MKTQNQRNKKTRDLLIEYIEYVYGGSEVEATKELKEETKKKLDLIKETKRSILKLTRMIKAGEVKDLTEFGKQKTVILDKIKAGESIEGEIRFQNNQQDLIIERIHVDAIKAVYGNGEELIENVKKQEDKLKETQKVYEEEQKDLTNKKIFLIKGVKAGEIKTFDQIDPETDKGEELI